MESHIYMPVFRLAEQHKKTWRNDPESVWLAGLIEEVAELAQSLVGKHEHEPEIELRQIAAICLNWLEMRDGWRQRQSGGPNVWIANHESRDEDGNDQ